MSRRGEAIAGVGLVLQVVSGVFVIGSYFVAEYFKQRERRQRIVAAQTGNEAPTTLAR